MAKSTAPYVKKYQEKRDAIMLRPSKEDGAKVRDAAQRAGKSVQAFVMEIVLREIEKGKEEKNGI